MGRRHRDPVRLLRPRVRRNAPGGHRAAARYAVLRRPGPVDDREIEIHAFARGAARPAEPPGVPAVLPALFRRRGPGGVRLRARRVDRPAPRTQKNRSPPRAPRLPPFHRWPLAVGPGGGSIHDLFLPEPGTGAPDRRPVGLEHQPAGVRADQRVPLSFLSEIPASFVTAPSGYSRDTVAAALRRYPAYAAPPADRGHERRVNLIVYMVESLMDPDDLGWRYSSDPIPNLRALWKDRFRRNLRRAGEHSGSSDSEFEALTGMTMSFLPDRSLAYRQFCQKPLPSLPAALKRQGYRTFAVAGGPEGILQPGAGLRAAGLRRSVLAQRSAGRGTRRQPVLAVRQRDRRRHHPGEPAEKTVFRVRLPLIDPLSVQQRDIRELRPECPRPAAREALPQR